MDNRTVDVYGLKISMFDARILILSSVIHDPYNLEARENYTKTRIAAGLDKLRAANIMPPISHETALALLSGEWSAAALRTVTKNDVIKPLKGSQALPIPFPWWAIAGLELIKSLQVFHETKGKHAHAEARLQIVKALSGPPFYYKGLRRTERLRKNWRKHAGCAHLCAALVLHGSWPENEEQLQLVASVAEHLRELGLGAQSAFAADPILNAQLTWALDPEFPRIGVSIDFETPFPIVRFGSNAIAY